MNIKTDNDFHQDGGLQGILYCLQCKKKFLLLANNDSDLNVTTLLTVVIRNDNKLNRLF